MSATRAKQYGPLILLLTALFGLLAYVLYDSIEFYNEEVDLGWSSQARRNPFLAADQYLSRLDIDVESSYQLDVVDALPTDATLIISNANAVLNERHAERLREWISAGGHVIIAAQSRPENQGDVFLDYFGVEKESDRDDFNPFSFGGGDEDDSDLENPDEETQEEQKTLGERFLESNAENQARIERERELERLREEGKLKTVADELAISEQQQNSDKLMYLSFNDDDYRYRVLLAREEYLSHPVFFDEEYEGISPFYWEGTEAGVGFMQFEVDDGLLTVLSDASIWNSDSIGLFDHAFLLEILTDNSPRVVFLFGANVPSLFDLLWQHFYELCSVLLLILGLWLIYRARRFGPILDTSYLGRRSFREHLSAVGDFFWRYKRREELLASARNSVWNEMLKKHIGTRALTEPERLDKLAELSRETPERVRVLMIGDVPTDEFMFYQRVKSLQKLRKQL